MTVADAGASGAPDWLEQAVLVYGPRKGGTTLFQNLLDGTDALFVYPAELKLKLFLREGVTSQTLESYYLKSRINTVKADAFDAARYEAQWQQALRDNTMVSLGQFVRFDAAAVFQSVRTAKGSPRLWAAKEVGGPADAILGLWRSLFPEAKALFIVRDPLMVTRAVIHDRRRKKIRLSIREIIKQTLDPMAVVTAQSRCLGDPRVHLLAYEDLVDDPAATMQKVAQFLGIPYAPVLTEPTVFGEPQVVRTSSQSTTKVFASGADWRDGLSLRERLAVALAARLARWRAAYGVDYPALRRAIRQSGAGKPM